MSASSGDSPGLAPGSIAGLRILLVEDHSVTREGTARLLGAQGATVVEAPTGEAAMRLLREQR